MLRTWRLSSQQKPPEKLMSSICKSQEVSEKKGLTGIRRRSLWRRRGARLKGRLNKGRRSYERRKQTPRTRMKDEITQEVNVLCTPSGTSDDPHGAFGGHAPPTDPGSMDLMIRQDPGLNWSERLLCV